MKLKDDVDPLLIALFTVLVLWLLVVPTMLANPSWLIPLIP